MDRENIELACNVLRNTALRLEHGHQGTELAARDVGEVLVSLGPRGLRAIATFLGASLELTAGDAGR